MAILKNARHEKFAQNLAKGMSATEAYAKMQGAIKALEPETVR